MVLILSSEASRTLEVGQILKGGYDDITRYPVTRVDEEGFAVEYNGKNYSYDWSPTGQYAYEHLDGAPVRKPFKPAAPALTQESLARALFQTDPIIIGTVAHVGELTQTPGYENRRAAIFQKAWDRNESDRRSVAMRRANEVFVALGIKSEVNQ